jgi:crotonobetainyl-CoA:carnitine CoA-transferase CaiB-like acyl-CoA transferase
MDILQGIRVLDFTQHQAGPYGAALLADFGADVVKIERPGGEPARTNHPDVGGVNAFFLVNNRGKRSACLDLSKPKARAVAQRLASRADVLVHNLKPGTMEKLGLGYAELRALNQRLVYAAVSTYGPKGSTKNAGGVDLIAQAESGIMSVTGLPEGDALPVGAAVADALGGINLAFSVMAALFARERTGEGQLVQISLIGGLLGLQAWEMQHHILSGSPSTRSGRSHPLVKTLWQGFRGSDGDFVIAEVSDSWPGICRAIDRPELAGEERFRSLGRRLKHRRALLDVLEGVFPTAPAAEWIRRLRAEGVLAAPVRSYADVATDPDTFANGYLRRLRHPKKGSIVTPGPFLHFSATPAEIRAVAPEVGEHTRAVLREAGYDDPEIDSLRSEGAIA